MKPYALILGASKDERAAQLNASVAIAAVCANDEKKTVSKILAAMIAAGDCKESEIRKTAESITGKDIRDVFQGVYELRVVFTAIVAAAVKLTEEQFDTLDASKIALISPFLQKDELKPMLDEAVELLKNGGTAKQIRELKPKGETKEPKAVREMREKAEAAEKKVAEAEERVKAAEQRVRDIEETYTVKCQFAVTDLPSTLTPVLESEQLRARIKSDLLRAKEAGDEESLLFQSDKLAKSFFGSCQLLGIDPHSVIDDIAAQIAAAAKGRETASAQTIEVHAEAA